MKCLQKSNLLLSIQIEPNPKDFSSSMYSIIVFIFVAPNLSQRLIPTFPLVNCEEICVRVWIKFHLSNWNGAYCVNNDCDYRYLTLISSILNCIVPKIKKDKITLIWFRNRRIEVYLSPIRRYLFPHNTYKKLQSKIDRECALPNFTWKEYNKFDSCITFIIYFQFIFSCFKSFVKGLFKLYYIHAAMF